MSTFGIVTVPIAMMLVFAIFMGLVLYFGNKQSDAYRRSNASLSPSENLDTEIMVGSIPVMMKYVARVTGRGGHPSTLTLTVPLSFGTALFLTKESASDRWLEKVGFSQTTHVGDREMDNFFHIVTDSREKTDKLFADSQTHADILAMRLLSNFTYLEFSDKVCRLHLNQFQVSDFENFDVYVNHWSQRLVALALKAQGVFGTQASPYTRFVVKRFSLYTSTVPIQLVAFGFFALIAFFISPFFLVGKPLYEHDGYLLTGAAAILILLVSLLVFRPWIRNWALPAQAFFSLLAGGVLWLFPFLMGLLLLLNSHLDTGSTQFIREPVKGKYIAHEGKNGSVTVYYVRVGSPAPAMFFPHDEISVKIHRDLYDQVIPYKSFIATDIHPGFLHIPWIKEWSVIL